MSQAIRDGVNSNQRLKVNLDGTANARLSAVKSAAITPHDTNALTGGATKMLYVGGTGDISVVMADDSTAVTLKAVPIGCYHLSVKQVKATGTTATNLVALY